jgi:CheY-like chemotaxis protein
MPIADHKVLIIDDEEKILTVTKKLLVEDGYQILSTADVEEALDIIEDQGPISVVVSDDRMPAMRGTEFLKKIKALCPQTVRILMTGHYDSQLIDELVNKSEVFRFLKKPMDFKYVKQYILEGIELYEDTLRTEALTNDLQKFEDEKNKLIRETNQRDKDISKLQNNKKTLLLAIAGIFLAGGLLYGYSLWSEREIIISTQVEIGNWVRYENGTSLDKKTGKVWMSKDFRLLEGRQPKSWEEAEAWVKKMNLKPYAGYNDWRLPTAMEYEETFDPKAKKLAYDGNEKFRVGYPQAFDEGGGYGYWSSDVVGERTAKYFFFLGGYSKGELKTYHHPTLSVRLVRN